MLLVMSYTSQLPGYKLNTLMLFFAISGDFNYVTLDSTLTDFYQFVDCAKRKNRTVDSCMLVRDAYSVTPLPPQGKSDHNLIQYIFNGNTSLKCKGNQ